VLALQGRRPSAEVDPCVKDTLASALICSRCVNAPQGNVDGSIEKVCFSCSEKVWVPPANQKDHFTITICLQCYEELKPR
jgi:hypothetical protein